MNWLKKGRIFCPDGDFGWMLSHAQVPTVLNLGDKLRVYFSTRPEPGLSVTAFLDVDARDPGKILYLHDKPVLEPGPKGAFDEHGAMPQYACRQNDEIWLYYAGWSRRVGVPYSNWTGLAISDDGGMTFRRAFPGPIVDRTPEEIYSATGCFILREDDMWHLWYASGIDWVSKNGRLEECYTIKYACSKDGIVWERENRQLLEDGTEVQPTHRPSVLYRDGRYHMLFCYRGLEDFRDGANAYRIGYASSEDRCNWHRDDSQAGLPYSASGWDSTMTAYPYILQGGDKVYLFYSGNGFGAAGFGYAELDS